MKLQPGAWTRRLVTIALPLLLLPAAFIPRVAARTRSSVDDELAYSTQTGFFFFWDLSVLTLEEESSEPGMDYWLLSDGEATIDLWAFTAPGATTEDCIHAFLDQLAADPTTESLAALPIDGGGPVEPISGVAYFVLTAAGPDGQEEFVATARCAEIVPDHSLFLEFVVTPASVYNERDGRVLLYGPGSGYGDGLDLIAYGSVQYLKEDAKGFPIWDETGQIAGTLATFLPCTGNTFEILAQGMSAAGEFIVAPSSLIAINDQGTSLPVTVTAWSLPNAHRQSRLALPANERGLLHGYVEAEGNQSFHLYYAGPSGETLIHTKRVCGGGAAGAAPVPIDID